VIIIKESALEKFAARHGMQIHPSDARRSLGNSQADELADTDSSSSFSPSSSSNNVNQALARLFLKNNNNRNKNNRGGRRKIVSSWPRLSGVGGGENSEWKAKKENIENLARDYYNQQQQLQMGDNNNNNNGNNEVYRMDPYDKQYSFPTANQKGRGDLWRNAGDEDCGFDGTNC
jgi:hypothetical protein